MTKMIICAAIFLLTACADGGMDYDASARCHELGKVPETEDYDNCVKEERALRLYKQQQELERRQEERRRQEILRRY